MTTRLGCFYVKAILSCGWVAVIEAEVDLSWGWSEAELRLKWGQDEI